MPEPSWHPRLKPWVNDPIPIWHDGRWHVFLQHNPAGPSFGEMCWGHVSSPNLVDWTEHPIALAPGEGCDGRGVWTGSVIRHEGLFWAFYTGISGFDPLTQHQCLAVSKDLMTWTRHPANPILPDKPAGTGECWRDPQLFEHEGRWLMAVGSQVESGGAVQLYGSLDGSLLKWEHLGPLWTAEDFETGFDCECPDFFFLDGWWVLITSRGSVHWQTGRFDGLKFSPAHRGVADGPFLAPGPGEDAGFGRFYAAKSAVDGGGRRLLFGWATKAEGEGWKGMTATPRVMSVDDDGKLRFAVPAELVDRFAPQADGSLRAEDGPLVERVSPEGDWTTHPDLP